MRDVSLRIDQGEVAALVGAKGSGKTTLPKLLARLYLPICGRVTWNDHSTADIDRRALCKCAALIFRGHPAALCPSLTKPVGVEAPARGAAPSLGVSSVQQVYLRAWLV
ncbi:MAG: ATP-binding cassette domain-containing protein [Gammaproteobacteria bacterium]|nr:ATP-binding cassette domain-containing protein [Gammaproteobacteria bacterium]